MNSIEFKNKIWNQAPMLTKKYPHRMIIVVSGKIHNKNICFKYICPNISFMHFQNLIRKKLKMKETEAIFLFTETNDIPRQTDMLSEVYLRHKDDFSVLFLTLVVENAFGFNEIKTLQSP